VEVVSPVETAVAVRAWAPRDGARLPGHGGVADLGPSPWTLVFDSETTTDRGQSLRVGAYQLRRGTRLLQAGFYFDPDALTAMELRTIETYAAELGVALMTRAAFVDDVFLRTAWNRRGLVVGHNLPFDLVRLSIAHHPRRAT
jgi:hypothetical protein